MLSLPEHIWGIFMIMKDCKPPSNIKPFLYKQIHDIIEDACSFDWVTAVRPWSEEVFSQVAENRIQWSDKAAIQMLCMSMFRCSTAKIDPANHAVSKIPQPPENKHNPSFDYAPKHRPYHQQASGEILRGGPPCDMYNGPQGCSLQSGHIVRGKRMIHVCRYHPLCVNNSNQVDNLCFSPVHSDGGSSSPRSTKSFKRPAQQENYDFNLPVMTDGRSSSSCTNVSHHSRHNTSPYGDEKNEDVLVHHPAKADECSSSSCVGNPYHGSDYNQNRGQTTYCPSGSNIPPVVSWDSLLANFELLQTTCS